MKVNTMDFARTIFLIFLTLSLWACTSDKENSRIKTMSGRGRNALSQLDQFGVSAKADVAFPDFSSVIDQDIQVTVNSIMQHEESRTNSHIVYDLTLNSEDFGPEQFLLMDDLGLVGLTLITANNTSGFEDYKASPPRKTPIEFEAMEALFYGYWKFLNSSFRFDNPDQVSQTKAGLCEIHKTLNKSKQYYQDDLWNLQQSASLILNTPGNREQLDKLTFEVSRISTSSIIEVPASDFITEILEPSVSADSIERWLPIQFDGSLRNTLVGKPTVLGENFYSESLRKLKRRYLANIRTQCKGDEPDSLRNCSSTESFRICSIKDEAKKIQEALRLKCIPQRCP